MRLEEPVSPRFGVSIRRLLRLDELVSPRFSYTVWECFQKNHLGSQPYSLEIGMLTLTAVETTMAIMTASNVNRILMRAVLGG